MRKIISIVVSLGVFLAASGCSSDQYSVEREYWRVKKLAANIFKNPAATPPNELERTVGKLQKFTQKNSQNILAVEAEFLVAKLYLAKSEFELSRKQLKNIITKYNKAEVICAEALFLTGNSYQIQDKWASALGQYKKIIADYPLTARGMEIPIFIAQYYKVNHQPDKMLSALADAISHYRSLAAKYPDSPLAFKAYTSISLCYSASHDWVNAAGTLNTIADKFKGKIRLDAILYDLALIYKRELKDPLKSQEIIDRIIKEYPDSRFVAPAKQLLKS